MHISLVRDRLHHLQQFVDLCLIELIEVELFDVSRKFIYKSCLIYM